MSGRADIHEHDDLTWRVGQDRMRVLAPLAAQESVTAAVVDAAAQELGLRRAQCYRKRGVTALLPARVTDVLGRLGAEGFELSIWTTLLTTRRMAVFAGSRF